MSASQWVHLDVDLIKKATDKAFLIVVRNDDDEPEEHWIPISQIADPDEYAEGDEDVTLSVTEWIADQKGLTGS